MARSVSARWFNDARDAHFARFQDAYGRFVARLINHRTFTIGVFALLGHHVSLFLFPVIGQDFFPSTDAGIDEAAFPRSDGDADRAH